MIPLSTSAGESEDLNQIKISGESRPGQRFQWLLFTIGGIIEIPRSDREMRASLPRGERRPTVTAGNLVLQEFHLCSLNFDIVAQLRYRRLLYRIQLRYRSW
jgi:hypothetical protein